MADGVEAARLTSDEIYRVLREPLSAFVRGRVVDRYAAEDVVSDVMLRMHCHLGELTDHDNVTAWAYRIARNAITDHYRRTARRPEALTPNLDDSIGAEEADGWVDDQQRVLGELAGWVRPLLARLPCDYRRAIELTDLGGLTQAEAARLEHVSVSGMKSRVQRARRQLAAMLAERFDVTFDATGLPTDCVLRRSRCGARYG